MRKVDRWPVEPYKRPTSIPSLPFLFASTSSSSKCTSESRTVAHEVAAYTHNSRHPVTALRYVFERICLARTLYGGLLIAHSRSSRHSTFPRIASLYENTSWEQYEEAFAEHQKKVKIDTPRDMTDTQQEEKMLDECEPKLQDWTTRQRNAGNEHSIPWRHRSLSYRQARVLRCTYLYLRRTSDKRRLLRSRRTL